LEKELYPLASHEKSNDLHLWPIEHVDETHCNH
jgi:hypothetical protein